MKLVGFDRRIRLEWLDKVAFFYYKTGDSKACAEQMKELMAGENHGAEARRKFYTVLQRIWVEVPQDMLKVRDRGLSHLVSCNNVSERLAVHWGMIMNVYPFFRDVVELIGDMFSLQDEITLAQIYRRTVAEWGERSTVKHALDKLVGSLWQWGALEKIKTGTYAAKPKLPINKENQLWLLECLLRSCPEKEMPLISALTSIALFPFVITLSKEEDLLSRENFELTRQGINCEMVSLIEACDYEMVIQPRKTTFRPKDQILISRDNGK